MARFIKLHFNSEDYRPERTPGFADAIRLPGVVELPTGRAMVEFKPVEMPHVLQRPNDETVARSYLERIFASRDDELRQLSAPGRPEVVPDLVLTKIEDSPLIPTRVVNFVQTNRSVQIFGTGAYVEIDGEDRRLITTDATLTDIPDVQAVASINQKDALNSIERYGNTVLSPEQIAVLPGPELKFFCGLTGQLWRLIYLFRKIPIVPPEQRGEHKDGHGLGPSPRDDFRFYDYLVDAHSAEVVYYFSSQPRLDIPVKCKGIDDVGQSREFYGLGASGAFQLLDPLRNIETFDHQGNDVASTALPTTPITNAKTDFAKSNTAGVSAHYHAKLVFDFFNDVLKRNGIDDKGMKLSCLVNVTYALRQTRS